MPDYWTDEDEAKGTDVDRWLEIYAKDDNMFWISSAGHHQNVIDELIYRLEQADKRAEERIIALLEKHLIPNAASGSDAEAFGWREGMRYAIALIKGEN